MACEVAVEFRLIDQRFVDFTDNDVDIRDRSPRPFSASSSLPSISSLSRSIFAIFFVAM